MALLSPTAAFVSDDGARIEIPAGAQLDEPVVLDVDLDAGAFAPEVRIDVGAGARASFVERVRGGAAGASAVLTRTLNAAARADVTYTVVQTAAGGARVEAARSAEIAAEARIGWNLALLGAAQAVDSLISRHLASGAATAIAALFFPVARENVDLTTEVQHDAPSTTSQTVARAIAAGQGRGRYHGNIRIAAHAHGCEATLRDDTLLIGSRAKIDAIPALEIAANDVKAFHGATVGAIDDEQIFYLTSRGIERGSAEELIALGFFEPALARFPGEALRDELRGLLAAKLVAAR